MSRCHNRIIFVLTGNVIVYTQLIVIIVLLDGQVSNTRQVIELVKKNSSKTSVFTMGIGNSVSKELVNGMAQAGNGYAEYAGGNERLQPKIIRQVNNDTLTRVTKLKFFYPEVPHS